MWFSSGYYSHSQPSHYAPNICSVITYDAEEAYRLIIFLHGATVCSGQVLLVVRLQGLTQTPPLDERSTRHRDLCLTKYNNHKKQIFMQPTVFEPAISTNELPKMSIDIRLLNTLTVRNWRWLSMTSVICFHCITVSSFCSFCQLGLLIAANWHLC